MKFDLLDQLGKCYYTLSYIRFPPKWDNSRGYSKTALSVENGHFEFIRMSFGFKNASIVPKGYIYECHFLNTSSTIFVLDQVLITKTSYNAQIGYSLTNYKGSYSFAKVLGGIQNVFCRLCECFSDIGDFWHSKRQGRAEIIFTPHSTFT